MKYMGSKNRIAKYILPIMLKDREEGQCWVEPFVGGANIIDKVSGNRFGSDNNKYLIRALTLIRDFPEMIPRNNTEYTKEMFEKARKSDLTDSIDCFAMFQYSFGSKFKSSWAVNKRGTDYVKECVKNVLKQSANLQGVQLLCCSYDDLIVPKNSIIYCDPPYEGTTKYKDGFNHSEFWQWCREKVKEGHTVFVSEYNAPDDFVCIWKKEILNTLKKDNNINKSTEKLFIYKESKNI